MIAHEIMRQGWKRWSASEVVVTVEAPGRIGVSYVDGCDGRTRATAFLSLARVERAAMHWVSYTLVGLDGTRSVHRGWLHDHFDDVSSAEADKAEAARRDEIADSHPRAVENEWRCYATAVSYQSRGISMGQIVAPTRQRPAPAEVEGAPL